MNPRIAKALSHPLRLKILNLLTERENSPVGLSKVVDANLSNITYHVKVLVDAEMVRLVRRVQRRGAFEHFYELVPFVLPAELSRVEIPGPLRSHILTPALKEIVDETIAALENGGFDPKYSRMHCIPLTLDSSGWKEVSKALDQATRSVLAAHDKSSKRLRDKEEDSIPTMVVVANFESSKRDEEGTSPDSQ